MESTLSSYRYEIDAAGAISVFAPGESVPFLFQATWPHGQAWGIGEADKWAKQLLLSMADVKADLPGNSPDQPTVKRAVE